MAKRAGGPLKPAIEAPAGALAANPLDALFQEWNGLIFRTAYRITGNAADAEDVLQTVFLRLLGRGGEVAAIRNPESYLRRAAIHASLDMLRGRRAGAAGTLDEQKLAAPRDPADLRWAIRQALAALDPRSAELFALRYFEGLPNRRIAEMSGMSPVWVAVALFRARRRLQRELAGYV